MIGVWLQNQDPARCVESIKLAEEAGVSCAWLTMARVSPDAPTIFAAAAMVTDRIKLGTSIVPTWPRHPVVLAQQAVVIDALAPGRFRLGIGPSTQGAMEPPYGVEVRKPVTQLREYLIVLQSLLHTGRVEFAGEFVKTRARLLDGPVDVPVMASALRSGAYRLCGELSDGAISWMCPWAYLKNVALSAMAEGAAQAGRPVPPVIVHVPVCLSKSPEVVREATRKQVAIYATVPSYQAMFAAAGFGDVSGGYPDALIDDLVVSGDAGVVVERLRALLNDGAGELIVHPLVVGANETAYLESVFDVIGRANLEARTTA